MSDCIRILVFSVITAYADADAPAFLTTTGSVFGTARAWSYRRSTLLPVAYAGCDAVRPTDRVESHANRARPVQWSMTTSTDRRQDKTRTYGRATFPIYQSQRSMIRSSDGCSPGKTSRGVSHGQHTATGLRLAATVRSAVFFFFNTPGNIDNFRVSRNI